MNGPATLPDDELWRILREDVPYGDLTTQTLGFGASSGRITFAARRDMRLAGIEEGARVLALCGAREVSLIAGSGADAARGMPVLQATGPAAALFSAWKTTQTLIEWCSGIATYTAQMASEIARTGAQPVLACTRKNVPGVRALSVKSIVAGGAVAHRLGLSETVLITAEHRAFLAGGGNLRDLAARCPEKRIVVEVLNHDEGLRFAAAGADVIQLEKFEPDAVRRFVDAVRAATPNVRVAAAGGIDVRNVAAYALSGADVLVSSAPYTAPPAEVRVDLHP